MLSPWEEHTMSIRKRTWVTAKGKSKEAFIVDYSFVKDGKRRRAIKTFPTEKAAKAFRGKADLHNHIPGHASDSVRDAADRWLEAVRLGTRKDITEQVEPATFRQYEYHVTRYIVPQLGDERLTTLAEDTVKDFRDRLLRKLSRGMARKVLATLKAILAENKITLEVTIGKDSRRHKAPIKPLKPKEIVRLLSVLEAKEGRAWLRWRALVATAIHTGMRPSELRGLPWDAVDLKSSRIEVMQRADEGGRIGAPKSAAARRKIDLPPSLVTLLREWRMQTTSDLVFANGAGNPESLANIHNRCWTILRSEAGIDTSHKLYALRHYHASALIDDGANPKEVQAEMGHSSIQVTFDVYGHLFHDDEAEQRRKQRAERLDRRVQHETRHRGEKVSKING
jgi:integrase